MSNKAARNLFIFGSLFFFVIFLALTVRHAWTSSTSRAPEITEEVDAGKMVWQKYDCIGCHTIFGNGSYFAPGHDQGSGAEAQRVISRSS